MMDLDVKTEGDVRTIDRVEYFELRDGSVYVERDGTSETIDGDLYGGSA